MYRAHYDLQVKPFQPSSDINFTWLGDKHREALAAIKNGVSDDKGLLVLTGDVGTGKTTLINSLIAGLKDEVNIALMRDPGLEQILFLNYVALSFGIGGGFYHREKFHTCFSRFLSRAHRRNKKVLFIIDECQLLSHELLREIYFLLNIISRNGKPLLNILLVGQCDFHALIHRPENQAIVRKLAVNQFIEPLTLEETGEYIRHRLKVAGTSKKIFKASAIKAIYTSSGGFPRRINILCDHCLMNGFAEDKNKIGKSLVKISSRELQVPRKRIRRRQRELIKKAAKTYVSFPAAGYVLAFLVVLSFSLLFFSHTGTTHMKENVASFAAQQAEIGQNGVAALENSSPPASKVEYGLAKGFNESGPLPGSSKVLPVILTDSPPEIEQNTQAPAGQGEEKLQCNERE